MGVKISRWEYNETQGICLGSKCTSQQNISYKEKTSNFTAEKPGMYHPNHMTKVGTISNKTYLYHGPLIRQADSSTTLSCVIPAKNTSPQSSQEKTPDQSKLRGIYKMTGQ